MERTVAIRAELEAILVEQALAMARELEMVGDAAPDGHVPAVSESAAIRAGREPTRRASEATLRRQAESAERKGLPADPAPAAAVAGPSRRDVRSAARRSRAWPGDRDAGHLDGMASPIVTAGTPERAEARPRPAALMSGFESDNPLACRSRVAKKHDRLRVTPPRAVMIPNPRIRPW